MKETTTFFRHALLSKEEDIHVLVLQNLETVVFLRWKSSCIILWLHYLNRIEVAEYFTCMCVRTHVYECVHVCMYVCMCVCVCVCVCMYVHQSCSSICPSDRQYMYSASVGPSVHQSNVGTNPHTNTSTYPPTRLSLHNFMSLLPRDQMHWYFRRSSFGHCVYTSTQA